jgi:hypothetical protein
MNELLVRIIDAHGGMDRWKGYEKVEAMIVSGGGFFALKGVLQDSAPRRRPYGCTRNVRLYCRTGLLISARCSRLRGSRSRNSMGRLLRSDTRRRTRSPVTTPFFLAMEGVRVEETESWREGEETWRVLRAYFPGSIETHSLVQDFFFGEDLTLRRHDYSVNIAGGFAAAQLTSDYAVANGIRLPTKRRAYTRGPDRRPILDMLMVSIDISDVSFA